MTTEPQNERTRLSKLISALSQILTGFRAISRSHYCPESHRSVEKFFDKSIEILCEFAKDGWTDRVTNYRDVIGMMRLEARKVLANEHPECNDLKGLISVLNRITEVMDETRSRRVADVPADDKTYESGVTAVIGALYDAADDYNVSTLDELMHKAGILASDPETGESISLLLGEGFSSDDCD